MLYLPTLLVSFGGVHTLRRGEPAANEFMFDLFWIICTFLLASVATARVASRQLRRRQLPFAKVPWYILAMGYAVVFFKVADLLPV